MRVRETVHLQFSVEESAEAVVRVSSGHGKGARFRLDSQRDTKRGMSVRDKKRNAGKQTPGERKRSQQQIREDSRQGHQELELPL